MTGTPHDVSALGPDEQVLGANAAARSVNEVLRALSRAARAFTLYDSKNAIMRRFLADYRAAVQAALTNGAFTVTVGPWEFLLGSEVVYREKDRERSLAFRLFRDGVRSLTVSPGFTFEEGVQLLEAISLRFTGVRQREDDAVTLLRKAAFTHLTFTAVEGFVPQEEEGGAPAQVASAAAGEVHVQAPPDFDLPLKPLQPVAFTWREVPERYLLAIRAEESPAAVRHAAVRLTGELLTAANGPASELSNAELLSLVAEVRDACLVEGAADSLLELVHVVRAQHGIGHELLAPLIDAIATPESWGRLLDALSPELPAPPPALVQLMLELGGDPVASIGARLKDAQDPALRHLLEELLLALAKRKPDKVLSQLQSLDAKVSAKLTTAMVGANPEQGLVIATRLAASAEPSAHLEALELVSHCPRSEQAFAIMLQFLASADDAVFAKAAQALAVAHESRGFDPLLKQVDARATADTLTRESATAAGEALVALVPRRAIPLIRQWAHPKAGFLSRLVNSPHERWLQVVAIAGLGLLAGPEAEAELRSIGEHTSDEQLKRHCIATVTKRRRAAAAGGPSHG
ncbi:MAG: hypothetical protein ACOZQL_21060 [Myxococcota bacterium]